MGIVSQFDGHFLVMSRPRLFALRLIRTFDGVIQINWICFMVDSRPVARYIEMCIVRIHNKVISL